MMTTVARNAGGTDNGNDDVDVDVDSDNDVE